MSFRDQCYHIVSMIVFFLEESPCSRMFTANCDQPISDFSSLIQSGACGPKAADVFLGVEGDISTGFRFTCDTSEHLCKCLVDVGDNSKTVVFQSDSPADTLTLQGDGEFVRYWFGDENRRRRLLRSKRAGSS